MTRKWDVSGCKEGKTRRQLVYLSVICVHADRPSLESGGHCGAEWTNVEQLSSFTSELWPVLRTQVVAEGLDPGLSSRPPLRSHRSIFWALDPLWF